MKKTQTPTPDSTVYRASVCMVKAMVVLVAVTAVEDILKSQGTYLEPYLEPV